jgi:hypothetical protein
MRSNLGRLTGLVAAGLLVIIWGCGDGRPSVDTSTAEATVKGTVKVRGKPATGGTIHFDPSNVKRKTEAVRSAPIGKDGSYTVKTLVGMNQITFTGPAFDKDRQLQDASVPYDVQSGEQTLNIELPPPT